MATSQEVIQLLRKNKVPEDVIAKKVKELGGTYTAPVNTGTYAPTLSTGISGPEDLINKTNLPQPKTSFMEKVGNFFAPMTTANIKDIAVGTSGATNKYVQSQEQNTQKLLELNKLMKKARELGDMETYQRLAQESKNVGQASEQTQAPEFSQYTQDQAAAGKTGTGWDYAGRGAKQFLEQASYVLPSSKALGITSFGGKVGLGALGGGMRGYGSSGYDKGLGGAVGGAAIGGSLSALGEGIKWAAKKVDKTGESLITKVFKKSQTNKFKEKTGEEMGEFMNRHKGAFKGDYFDDSIKLSEKFQNDFDELARRSGVKIKSSDVKSVFQKEIDRLRATGLSKNISVANKLEKEVKGILGSLGKTFDISDLTNARVEADKLTSFGNTTKTRDLYKTVRDLEQEVVQNAVGDKTVGGLNLKEIGKELNKIYTFKDMARNIQSSNAGGKALSLTSLLAGGGGGIVGGFPGAVTGIVANQALSSPTGTRIASNLLQNVAKPTLNAAGTVIGSNLARQAVIGGLSAPQSEESPESLESGLTPQSTPLSAPQTQETLDMGNLPTPQKEEAIVSDDGYWKWDTVQNKWTPNQATGGAEEQAGIGQTQMASSLTGYTPEILYSAAIKAYQAGDKSAYSQLINMYEDETKYQEKQAKAKKEAGKGTVSSSIDMMEQLYGAGTSQSLSMGAQTVGLKGLKARGGVEYKKLSDQNYVDRLNNYKTQMGLVAGAINVAAGAGVLNGGEYERLAMKSFPNEYTSETVARAWFENARKVLNALPEDRLSQFSEVLENYSNGGF